MIDKLILHAADTPSTMDIGAKEINEWHIQRGWEGIGYHFVIRRNGKLEYGRPINKTGAHVKGHNKGSIGICLVGRKSNYTKLQIETLHRLLQSLKMIFPKATIHQHSEFDKQKPNCAGLDLSEFSYI